MSRGYWRWLSAVALGTLLGIYAGYWLAFAEPRSYTLIPGGCVLEAAAHEASDGYFNCSTLSLAVPRASVPADILRSLLGERVEIVVRVVEPRELAKVSR